MSTYHPTVDANRHLDDEEPVLLLRLGSVSLDILSVVVRQLESYPEVPVLRPESLGQPLE